MFNHIKNYITKHSLLSQGTKVVIGLSGGPDSTFLFYFLVELHKNNIISLIAAHLDHQWRPTSAQDEQFCRSLAEKHNIPFVSTQLNKLAITFKKNSSQEEYGRKVRRFFLESVLREYDADCIALAHHAQDQQETFFIRLIRGSSLTGLTAMKPQAGVYIRPLLEINKTDILTWLANNNYTYLIDETNESFAYLRNRIRNVLNDLRHTDTRFDRNFATTLQRLQDTEQFLEKHTDLLFSSITEHTNDTLTLNCKQFITLDPVIQHRILIKWLISEHVPFYPTENFLNEIVRFLKSNRGGTHTMHTNWIIIKKQSKAFINPNLF